MLDINPYWNTDLFQKTLFIWWSLHPAGTRYSLTLSSHEKTHAPPQNPPCLRRSIFSTPCCNKSDINLVLVSALSKFLVGNTSHNLSSYRVVNWIMIIKRIHCLHCIQVFTYIYLTFGWFFTWMVRVIDIDIDCMDLTPLQDDSQHRVKSW